MTGTVGEEEGDGTEAQAEAISAMLVAISALYIGSR